MLCYGRTPETEVQSGESSVLPREMVMEMTGREKIGLAFPSFPSAVAWPSKGRLVPSLLF